MGSVGDSYDNAMAESLWASLKRELVYEQHFRTKKEARLAVFEWIIWYNTDWLYSSLGYVPPEEFEELWWSQQTASFGVQFRGGSPLRESWAVSHKRPLAAAHRARVGYEFSPADGYVGSVSLGPCRGAQPQGRPAPSAKVQEPACPLALASPPR